MSIFQDIEHGVKSVFGKNKAIDLTLGTDIKQFKIAKQSLQDTFGFIPAAGKAVLNMDPSILAKQGEQWWSDVSDQSQRDQDIWNPPSAQEIAGRKIQRYQSSNPAMNL